MINYAIITDYQSIKMIDQMLYTSVNNDVILERSYTSYN